MKALITGAAGFIGSHLVEAVLDRGIDVIGIDGFTPYYQRQRKEANTALAHRHDNFTFVEADLTQIELEPLLHDVDVVFHLAGQPGVRGSWADGFLDYVHNNVVATQRVLEASLWAGVKRVVYASSSSVYGNAAAFPCREEDVPAPHSPYGVTKLAGEHLCRLYSANFGLPTVSLRYFTVFGPRQRPDLAMMALLDCVADGRPFTLFGTGDQIRDFTYIDDVVEATLLSGFMDVEPGTVFNVAGGSPASMNEVIDALAGLGHRPNVERRDPVPGDVVRTGGATDRIADVIGWHPRVGLHDGLARQIAWARASQGQRNGKEAA